MHKLTPKNIIIISTCYIDWGGSEELWAAGIPHLQLSGFKIILYKQHINRLFYKFSDLADHGVILKDHNSTLSFPYRIMDRCLRVIQRGYREIKHLPPVKRPDTALIKNLKTFKPQLAIISQGINFDGLIHAYECLLLNIPYVIISQKAVDFYWPDVHARTFMTKTLLSAKKTFFVSGHNLKLTEEQFGIRLPKSEVIFNPVKSTRRVIAYPATSNGYRLACVARLFLLDKGQDMLIRILSKTKWRERPLSVSFIGSGDDHGPLLAMAKLLNVNNISFTGHINDVETVWDTHHALIHPARSEGLPISVIEAMANGRTVIVTNAGGTAEHITDGVTGFVGKTDEYMLEEAMERAWNRRSEWQAIGLAAAQHIKEIVPENPGLVFSNHIKDLVND